MTQNLTDVERVIRQTRGYLPRHLFVLAGPSGVGKNTIIKKLLTNHPGEMGRVVTYTTRERRENEVEGEQYHFVSYEKFRELALAGKLMEADAEIAGHDVYHSGHLYSMPTDIYEGIPPEKHLVIAEVDIHGMRRLRERYPDCVTIFVTAPPTILLERIFKRTDKHMDASSLALRMETAREQIKAAKEFDYIVFNNTDGLQRTMTSIETIIHAERMRVRHGADLEAVIPEEAFTQPLDK
jgi:guanylate kinase